MPNGRVGDHPVTDILDHHVYVFSPVIDDLVRRLERLASRDRLWEMFNWFDPPALPEFERQLRMRIDLLERDARERGWEI